MNALTRTSPFDAIKQTALDGSEYWSARDMQPLMAYSAWRNFEVPIQRAIATATNQGHDVDHHFARSRKMVSRPQGGGIEQEDYHLSRFAAYLVAMNGDPNKPEVAAAQAYFAIQTRAAETAPTVPALTEDQIVHQALQITAQRVQALEAENRALAPKASRYDTFLGADGDYPLRDAAQILSRDHGIKIGQNNLAKWMRSNQWIDRRGIPYQHRIDAGHLRAKPRTYKHPRTGEDMVADPQVRVTPQGLNLLALRLTGPRLLEAEEAR